MIFLDARMQLEVGGTSVSLRPSSLQQFERQPRVVVLVPLGALVRLPVDLERRLVVRQYRLVGVIAAVQRSAKGLDHLLGIRVGDHFLRGQAVGVDLARRRMLMDALVHQRLRDHRLVLLVVAEPAIAHEIDHHVLAELHAKIERDLGHQAYRFRIVAVDVENRHFEHLRHVAAIQRRARIAQIGRGESDLIVDDDVHRAAGAEAARLREIQRFHHHALPRIRRVAVDQHRQHLPAGLVAAAVLARAHRAFDHRIDDLQVRRIERERQMQRPAGRHDVREKPS